jgi:hypothetical protein
MIKTISDVRIERKLSQPKTVTTKRALTFSSKPETACVIPAGTRLDVYFSETRPDFLHYEYNGSVRISRCSTAYLNFTGFSKPPTLPTLERYSNDGVAKTPTGERTEPDGFGQDGSPSWLLVLAII